MATYNYNTTGRVASVDATSQGWRVQLDAEGHSMSFALPASRPLPVVGSLVTMHWEYDAAVFGGEATGQAVNALDRSE